MQSPQYIVIAGCGRLGALLASQLSARGDSVVILDKDERSFSALSPDFTGFTVAGDATEMEILRKANVAKADLVVATTQDDNVNIFVSLLARKIAVEPRVLARILDTRRQAFCARIGVDALSPTAIVAQHFLDRINDEAAT